MIVAFSEPPTLNHYHVTIWLQSHADFIASVWLPFLATQQDVDDLTVANRAGKGPEPYDIANPNCSNHNMGKACVGFEFSFGCDQLTNGLHFPFLIEWNIKQMTNQK
jgi:hypothetical protein